MPKAIRMGVSACLLGENVRYDGGHKRDPYLVDTLGTYFTYVPVCPEVECGLAVPRESMRLVGDPQAPRLTTTRTGLDLTEKMETWARGRVEALRTEDLCGFIFKSQSPSSGMERVKVYAPSGMASKTGVGVFARIFMAHFPMLPVEEEGRLHDPALRENFIERVFALKNWRDRVVETPSVSALVAFQTANKLLVMSHSPQAVGQLGRLVAQAGEGELTQVVEAYGRLFASALALRATRKKQTNVLHHAMGYFKKIIAGDEKSELLETIELYYTGLAPLVVPLTLIKHYARKYDVAYLLQQTYLQPHPIELQLRNHA